MSCRWRSPRRAAADAEHAEPARDGRHADGFYFGFLPRWTIFQGPFPQVFSFIMFLIARSPKPTACRSICPKPKTNWSPASTPNTARMKFAAFFMAEYANMITVTSIATLLFLGGWHPLFPTEYGSWLIPVLLFVVAGLISIFHGLNPARPFDRITLPVFGVDLHRHRAAVAVPLLQPYLLPLFWFCGQDRLSAVHLYLDSRHAAALPL